MVRRVGSIGRDRGLCGAHTPAVRAQQAQPSDAGHDPAGDHDHTSIALYTSGGFAGIHADAVNFLVRDLWDCNSLLYLGRISKTLVLQTFWGLNNNIVFTIEYHYNKSVFTLNVELLEKGLGYYRY